MESVSEEWRAVKGYEGRYEVSDMGRVRSLDRIVVCRNGVRKPLAGRVLAHGTTCGYAIVNLEKSTKYVHRLVLEAFVGPCPSGMEGCHGPDHSRLNCRLANLRWDTPKANQCDRVDNGTSNRGEQCAAAKLTAEQAQEIFASTERGCDLARKFGVAQQTICSIRKGRNWAHLRPETSNA